MSLNYGHSLFFDVDDAVHQQMTNWRGPFAIAMDPQTRKAYAFTVGQSPDSMTVRKGHLVISMHKPWVMLVTSTSLPGQRIADSPEFGEIYTPDHGAVTEVGKAFALEKGKAPTIEELTRIVENPLDVRLYKSRLASTKRAAAVVAENRDDTAHPGLAPA